MRRTQDQKRFYDPECGSWSVWANDTATHYAAIHCPHIYGDQRESYKCQRIRNFFLQNYAMAMQLGNGKKEAGLQPAGVQDKEIQYHPLCSSRI